MRVRERGERCAHRNGRRRLRLRDGQTDSEGLIGRVVVLSKVGAGHPLHLWCRTYTAWENAVRKSRVGKGRMSLTVWLAKQISALSQMLHVRCDS